MAVALAPVRRHRVDHRTGVRAGSRVDAAGRAARARHRPGAGHALRVADRRPGRRRRDDGLEPRPVLPHARRPPGRPVGRAGPWRRPARVQAGVLRRLRDRRAPRAVPGGRRVAVVGLPEHVPGHERAGDLRLRAGVLGRRRRAEAPPAHRGRRARGRRPGAEAAGLGAAAAPRHPQRPALRALQRPLQGRPRAGVQDVVAALARQRRLAARRGDRLPGGEPRRLHQRLPAPPGRDRGLGPGGGHGPHTHTGRGTRPRPSGRPRRSRSRWTGR